MEEVYHWGLVLRFKKTPLLGGSLCLLLMRCELSVGWWWVKPLIPAALSGHYLLVVSRVKWQEGTREGYRQGDSRLQTGLGCSSVNRTSWLMTMEGHDVAPWTLTCIRV